MNSRELFKLYFSKQLTENKSILLLVVISLIIGFSISIFVPIISYNQNKAITNNVDKINGGDIKIEGNMILEDIKAELFKIDSNAEIIKNNVMGSVIKEKKDNKFIFDLLIGDYKLNEDEIILAGNTADYFGYKRGDEIEILVNNGYKKFTINGIENISSGVTSQAEFIGYGKINQNHLSEKAGEPNLIIINSKSVDIIKDKFENKFPNLKLTTIEDARKDQEDSIKMQSVAMNLLNVMGYILMMSVLAGTIMMFLIKYRRDISILKLLFIKNTVINRAIFIEFFSIGIVSLVLSLPISFIAQQIITNSLGIQNTGINSQILILIFRGFIINFFLLMITVKVLSSAAGAISPMSLLNKDYTDLFKKIKRLGIILLPLILVSMFLYGVFSGENMLLLSFFMILVLMSILLLMLLLMFFILTKIPVKNEVLNYTSKTFRNEKGINILLILNTTLLLIFFLIGFKFPNFLKLTYDEKLENDIPYNNMIASEDLDNIAIELKEKLDGDKTFTLFSSEDGLMVFEDKIVDIFEVGVDIKNYNNKFKVIEGEDLIETEKDGILISEDFKSKEGLKINDEIQIVTQEKISKHYIRGIYDNGTINSNWILKPKIDKENSMILLKTDKEISELEISNAVIASLDQVGQAMLKKADEFLRGFRYICLIFSGSALLFNVLLMMSNGSMKMRDFTIIRALSKKDSFIKISTVINFLYATILSSVCAVTTYWLVGQFVFKIILDLEMVLDNKTVIMTIVLSVIFNFITYSQMFFRTSKFIDYNILRSD
ncbi:ABC transporter permease [Facklamia miroungae]|uniref:ABC-type transport system, involved in lipoprotein release, permease component n=1 Tax=Facklamia miroungae TaxID=120956 RepID=A0A1G7RFU3_9LACT|nr:ABC transporter permease [Facklamia miroungae]NKZ29432.1 ABC transporter permease [Facklamia miroungae]SDG09514.1 ABC-type transport system, involved in lipoprotein release, permease component [Facklamia miroungae]